VACVALAERSPMPTFDVMIDQVTAMIGSLLSRVFGDVASDLIAPGFRSASEQVARHAGRVGERDQVPAGQHVGLDAEPLRDHPAL
jgi:hypothetical protein